MESKKGEWPQCGVAQKMYKFWKLPKILISNFQFNFCEMKWSELAACEIDILRSAIPRRQLEQGAIFSRRLENPFKKC
jgi:hypothetical protein